MDPFPSPEDHALMAMSDRMATHGVSAGIDLYLTRHQLGWNPWRAFLFLTARHSPQSTTDVEMLWNIIDKVEVSEKKDEMVMQHLMETALGGNANMLSWATKIAETRPDIASKVLLNGQRFLSKFPDDTRVQQPEWRGLWQAGWRSLAKAEGSYYLNDTVFTNHLLVAGAVKELLEVTGGVAEPPSLAVGQEWKASADSFQRLDQVFLEDLRVVLALGNMGRKVMLEAEATPRNDKISKPRAI